MTRHQDLLDSASLYALEVLDKEERERFESHLASGCDECQTALREARSVTDALVLVLDPVRPSKEVRAKLFERVRQDRGSSEHERASKPRSRIWIPLAAAASLLAALGLGLHAYSLRQSLDEEQQARQEVETRFSVLQDAVDALTAPRTQTVALAGQGSASGAVAKAFIDPDNRRLFLYVHNLPPLPPGSTYQLWLIVDGVPVSAGVFGVEPNGTARLDGERIPALEGAITVAVTVEPAGGVPQPTGPMVLLGS